MEAKLTIVPVLNKIDLPIARPDFVIGEMEQAVVINPDEVMHVSAKTGIGIEDLLEAIIDRVPPARRAPWMPRKSTDLQFATSTAYKGVVVYIRMVDGTIRPGQRTRLMRTGQEYVITEIGQFRPGMENCEELSAGQVGYFTANIKNIERCTHRRYRHGCVSSDNHSSCRLQGTQADGLSGLYPSTTTNSRICGKPWPSSDSNDVHSHISRKLATDWVSVSAAASWGCCIARSSSNAWNAIAT